MSLPSANLTALPEQISLFQERPFQAIRFASPLPGPHILVTAAVHGNETAGTFAMTRLVKQIEEGDIKLQGGALTLIPVTNPKAYRLQRRAGDRNLNRRLSPVDHPEQYEDHVANWLCPILAEHDGLLDLHSFQSGDIPFALFGPQNNQESLEPFAQAAIEDEDHFKTTCEAVIHTREGLVRELTALGFDTLPSQANFILTRHPLKDAAELLRQLRDRKILVRHFALPRIEQHLRISVGTPAECQTLIEALKDILNASASEGTPS